jgi:hypothetical protein
MDGESLVIAISKLAVAGEQAGFSLEQMIQLLDSGLSVKGLMDIIAWRFEHPRPLSVSSYWAV